VWRGITHRLIGSARWSLVSFTYAARVHEALSWPAQWQIYRLSGGFLDVETFIERLPCACQSVATCSIALRSCKLQALTSCSERQPAFGTKVCTAWNATVWPTKRVVIIDSFIVACYPSPYKATSITPKRSNMYPHTTLPRCSRSAPAAGRVRDGRGTRGECNIHQALFAVKFSYYVSRQDAGEEEKTRRGGEEVWC